MTSLRVAWRYWRTFTSRRVRGVWFRYKHLARGTYIEPELSVVGPSNIHVGAGVVIQRRASLYTQPGSRLDIGDGCRIGTDVIISVGASVRLGREVLFAPRCFVSDHNHEFSDRSTPVMRQGMAPPAAVDIGDGTWLGVNVCILRGVTLGRNCVVAANSVVTRSFPDGSVVGGSPARLLQPPTSALP